jgi:hypothetical protein
MWPKSHEKCTLGIPKVPFGFLVGVFFKASFFRLSGFSEHFELVLLAFSQIFLELP